MESEEGVFKKLTSSAVVIPLYTLTITFIISKSVTREWPCLTPSPCSDGAHFWNPRSATVQTQVAGVVVQDSQPLGRAEGAKTAFFRPKNGRSQLSLRGPPRRMLRFGIWGADPLEGSIFDCASNGVLCRPGREVDGHTAAVGRR